MLPKNDSEKMKNVISNTTEFLLNQIKQSKRVIFQSVSNGITGTSKILYNCKCMAERGLCEMPDVSHISHRI